VTDNYFYVRTGYIQTLQSMPEPLRSQMLEGDFKAGVEDDEWQSSRPSGSTLLWPAGSPATKRARWTRSAAIRRWAARTSSFSLPRHGTWFDQLIRVPGTEVPDGQTGAAIVIKHRRDRAVVNIDVIGWGSSTLNMLQENEVQCHSVNGANGSLERSKEGALKFANYRSEIVWRMREALDPTNPIPMRLAA
jgi:hypothetical protein